MLKPDKTDLFQWMQLKVLLGHVSTVMLMYDIDSVRKCALFKHFQIF